MLNRNAPLVVCLALLSGAAFAQNPQGVGYAVEFSASSSGQFQAYPENSATFASSSIGNTGPAGPNQIIAKPDGSKFYVLGAAGLDSIDPAFTTPKPINGFTGTLTQGTMTPDGRYLLVSSSQGTGSGTVFVLNTTNDTVVLNQPVTGNIIGVVVSQNAGTAWILGESSGTFITIVNLSTMAQTGSPVFLRDPATGGSLGGNATSFTLSPLGLLYVTAGNQILEINPTVLATCQGNAALTCSPTTVISVNATPGPLQFTPDGAFGYFLNQTPAIGGQALYRLSFPAHNTVTYASTEVFDSVMIAGQNRIFAHSPNDTTLWDVAGDLSSVTVSTLQNVLPATAVYSAVISDELPSAKYLFVMAGGVSLSDVYLVNLSTNSVTAQAAASLGLGPLQFVYVPSQNPAGFTTPLTYNATQTNLAVGATANPLIARVLDQNGNPVYNVPVVFSGDPSLTINPANTTTNASGFAQAIATMGSNPGNFPVTMTAGTGNNTITATFSLAIPGGSTGTGTGPNGTNQLSIVTGNGQLFESGVLRLGATNNLLTVQLVDMNGNPYPNQNVTFTVTGPAIGVVGTPQTTTDQNGMANSSFFPGYPGESIPFEATTVVASATDTSNNALGSVTFTETIYQNNLDGTGAPTVTITQPSNTLTLTGGEGAVIPNAISAVIYSGAFGRPQPIPNLGIRIADASNPNLNGAGTCQGNPLSDQTGTINCNFIPACATSIGANGSTLGFGLHGFDIVVGEYESSTGFGVIITQGSTQMLTIPTNGGNKQNGSAGSALPLPLTVLVTDACGAATPNISVTWKVTSGSGTLSATSTVSNAGGTASTKLTLGTNSGSVTVTATINGTTTVTFTETINAIVGSLSLFSGEGQSALEGAPFSQPLVFALKDNKGNPLSGFTVNFSLAGGSAALNVTSGTTNPQGQVSVSVTAGNTPGTVTVNATFQTFSASATLTVTQQGPGVSVTSFVNAASFQAGLVPCGLATVTGSGLDTTVNSLFTGSTLGIGPLPYTLEGVSISVNGSAAPILSVSNQNGVQQVNFQTPCEVTSGPGTVNVEVGSATTTVSGVVIYPIQPGIFTYAGPGGVNYAAIISEQNGGYLTPSNLAHAGQAYVMVVTGLGQTTPNAVTNSPGTGSQTVSPSEITLAIDNIGVPVTSVQYVEGAVGEYLITFTIPATANGQPFPTGTNLPISLGGLTSSGQTIFDSEAVAIPGIE